MMEKEFVPYELGLELKQLGFKETCLGWFADSYLRIGAIVENKHVQGEGETLAPTYSQAFRWFREKGYENWISHNEEGYQFIIKWEFEHSGGIEALKKINSYEEAELACLKKLIEIVKEKQCLENL